MMRTVLLSTAALSIFATDAHADASLDAKICVINTAAGLPNVPGLRILTSRATPMDAATAADSLWSHTVSSDAMGLINDRLGYPFTDRVQQEYRQEVSGGQYIEANKIAINALAPVLSGGSRVEIDFNAAGVDATFAAVCAWTASGSQMSAPLGIVR